MIRVLYVDDTEVLLFVVKRTFETSGTISVDACPSVTEALSRLATMDYDVIITDYWMPVMNGGEFITRVKSMKGDVPCILYSIAPLQEIGIPETIPGIVEYVNKEYDDDGESPFGRLERVVREAVLQD